jgi:hypothetical protein
LLLEWVGIQPRLPTNKKATPRSGLTDCFRWCPQSESNQHLMITNQKIDHHFLLIAVHEIDRGNKTQAKSGSYTGKTVV